MKSIILVVLFSLALLIRSERSRIFLNSTQWYFREESEIPTQFSERYYKSDIPSTVHLDLLANGLMPDPYYRDNLLQFYQLEKKSWRYRTVLDIENLKKEFTLTSATEIQLVFEGLDTYADVYLDNQLILSSNNMFRTWTVSGIEKTILKANKEVTLEILFHSAVEKDLISEDLNKGFPLPYNYTYSRKAAYQYGWDWGPRLVTCGIWKDAYFSFIKKASISSVHFETKNLENVDIESGTGDADILIQVDIQSFQQQDEDVALEITYENQTKIYLQLHSLQFGNQTITYVHQINNSKLWWCQGMGKPNLHSFTFTLFSPLNSHETFSLSNSKNIIDQKSFKTGFRQIKVLQNQDSVGKGTGFTFQLNGYYVFARGANYIPPDMFMPRAMKNPQVYVQIIESAIKSNHNFIRLWGGGQFEYDIFYELCDQKGLMIWHDLMFACAMYPASDEILFNIEQEMIDNVSRLRHHPSIAVWNGNNEVAIGWENWGWQSGLSQFQKDTIYGWYVSIFDQVIPQVLNKLHSDVFYWPTSPSSNLSLFSRSKILTPINSGDIHFWDVWASGAPIEDYNLYVGRFVSEYGMQGIPSIESIRKFTLPEDRNVNSTVMALHERHIRGWPLLQQYVTEYYQGFNDNFEECIYLSQVMQAQAISTAILAHRRNMPYCSGSLYWQLNDVWPVVSWASVDSYGNWKALHFRQKHLFQDIILAVEEKGTNLNDGISQTKGEKNSSLFNIRVISDLHKQIEGKISIILINASGDKIQTFADAQLININPVSSNIVLEVDMSSHLLDLQNLALYLKINYNNDNDRVWSSVHFFVKPNQFKSVKFARVQLNPNLEKGIISISAQHLAVDLKIFCEGGNDIIGISNNYFDVVPFEAYEVYFNPQENKNCQEIRFTTLNEVLSSKVANQFLQNEKIFQIQK